VAARPALSGQSDSTRANMEGIAKQVGAIFSLRKGEVVTAFLMFAYLFLVIAAYIIGKAVSASLFISRFGALKLPYAIIGQAILIAFIIAFYLKLSRRLKHHLLISATLLFLAANALFFWWAASFRPIWLTPVFYIWVGIYGVIAPTQVWTFANFIFNTREAKRLFGLIGSGGILGAIFGGYISEKLAPRIGTENLLPAIAACALLCALLVLLIRVRNRDRIEAFESAALPAHAPATQSLKQSVRLIAGSRYLLLITAIITISSLSTKILDVQFSAIVQNYFSSKDEMTAFFGAIFKYMNLASFTLQFFFTSKLIGRLGIGITIFVLPLSLLLGSVTALIYATLGAAILLRVSDQVLKHSVDKSTMELLYLPVPSEIKFPVKSFIDTVIWRAGDGLAGIVLLIFTQMIPIIQKSRPGWISLVNFPFIAFFLFLAYSIKREYVNSLRLSIQRRELDPKRTAVDISEPVTLEVLTKYLDSPEEKEALYALDLLELAAGTDGKAVSYLKRSLRHASPAVRLKALNKLSVIGEKSLIPEVETLLRDESLAVRAAAVRYLYTHCDTDPLPQLTSLRDYPDHSIQGAVIVFLLKQGDPENIPIARMMLDHMLGDKSEAGKEAKLEAAKILGLIPSPSPLHEYLGDLLRDDSPEVARQALESAGKIQRREYIPLLLERLSDPETRMQAREALAQHGAKIIGTLRDHLHDEELALELRKNIPRLFSLVETQDSVNLLIDSLGQKHISLRYEVAKALNKLRAKGRGLVFAEARIEAEILAEINYHYRMAELLHAYHPAAHPASGNTDDLLTKALEERAEQALERIFRLSGLIYPPADIHHAYHGLTRGTAQVQANAAEFLDNLLRPNLKRLLIPMVDHKTPLAERASKGRSFWKREALSTQEALAELISGNDRWLKACAIYAAGKLEVRELLGLIENLRQAPDPLIAETAQAAWRKLQTPTGVF
jgi:AAA family ATP:ADP antiporter